MAGKGIKLGAGWSKKSNETGEEYYDCVLHIKARVMFNKYKKGEKSPDIVLYGYEFEKPQEARPKTPYVARAPSRPPQGRQTTQSYVDHTRPPETEVPWPEGEDEMPQF